MDQAIGELLGTIRELNQQEDTLVGFDWDLWLSTW